VPPQAPAMRAEIDAMVASRPRYRWAVIPHPQERAAMLARALNAGRVLADIACPGHGCAEATDR